MLLGLLLVAAGAFGIVRYALFPPERIPRGAIVVPRDVATLDAALRRVEPGGTIVLDTHEQALVGPFVIDVPEVTICSFGPPARVTAQGNAPALAIRANDVTLRNLEISAESVGLVIASSRCLVEDLTVRGTPVAVRLSDARDCTLDRIDIEGGNIGVELSSSSGAEIRAVTVSDVAEVGIRVTGSWGNTLERITVARAPVGISVEDGSRQTLLADCHVDDCGTSGVIVRGSNDITLASSIVRDAPVGIALDRATGCEIRGCTIERAAVTGVSLERSVQNRVQNTVIRTPGQFGLRLSESSENAFSDNEIRGGSAVAIDLTASDRNLVVRNEIADTAVGIRIDRSEAFRILRNTIASRRVGLVLEGADGGRILDNRVTSGVFGIAIVSSTGNVVLRNRVEDQAESAFALLGGSASTTLAENRAARSGTGILIAASSRSDVLDNVVVGNDIGVLLLRSGPELRLEGNRIERNAVGLRQADPSDDSPARLGLLDADIPADVGEISPPILANNTFSRNRRLDVENNAMSPLYAAGNQWGDELSGGIAEALVSPDVNLLESAWKGTIAVGTEASDLQEILGDILRIALARAGYRVVDLIGMGSARLVQDAAKAGDIDLVSLKLPGTGPSDAGAELTVFVLPARAGWVAVVPQGVADRLPERSLSALAAMLGGAGQALLWAVPQAVGEPVLAALRDAYGLGGQVRTVVWAKTLAEAEALLTFGAAEFALLESLEETVTLSGFVSLEDDRHILPSEALAVMVRTGLLADHPDVGDVLSRLVPRLTPLALRDLMSRVRLLDRSPEAVAMEFLEQQGLLPE
ncbi:MAG: right-handed parallel beta-helix repeat-containing protein [bacterium]